MAKVAICNAETGQLTDICDEADKFQIYEGPDATLVWVDVPDSTTYEHFRCNGQVIHREDTEDLRVNANVDRVLAYGEVGEQLDMQYKDAVNGTTTWKDHVANVKATTTKPSTIPAFVEDEKKVQLVGRKAWEPWVDDWVPPVG